MKVKIAFLVLVAFILIFGSVIFSKLMNASSNERKERLVSIAQTQTEIMRITGLAETKTNGSDLQNLNIITKLSVQSSSNDTNELLVKNKIKPESKLLNKGRDSKNDELLTQATNNSSFDSTYRKLLQEQLTKYQSQLKTAFENGTKAQKEVFSEAGQSNTLILEALKRSDTSIQ